MQPHIAETLNEIFTLYEKHGADNYIGENISQIEHMCQSAQLAERAGMDDEVILAAFFHDIGHLAEHLTEQNNMGGYGIKEHEKVGADYLRGKGFSEKIASLVQSHVEAKRYLTYKYEEYYNALSEASKRTLEFQGGKMSKEEAEAFEQHALFETMILLRRWDEEAKLENIPLPDINYYKQLACKTLSGM